MLYRSCRAGGDSGTLGRNERILAEGRALFFAVRNWMCGVCTCVNR